MADKFSVPSREFRFVAACCARPLTRERLEMLERSAREPLDWARVSRLVALHRIDGLVNEALIQSGAAVPPDKKDEFTKRASALVRENLEITAEAIRLKRLFASAGISLLFLKGITLAVVAYGNIGIRHGKDIDLLVAPEDATAATSLIENAGYRRDDPPPELNEAMVQSLRPVRKDLTLHHRTRDFEVELHWRPLDNRYVMGGVSPATSSQDVRVGTDITLATLAEKDLFAYLCAHGANHCWYRLKWIADICAILGTSPERIESLYRAASERGVGPAAGQALLLCRRLFASPVPDTLLQRLRASLRVRWLERIALWAMTSGNEQRVPPDLPFGATKITLSRYLLRSGLGYWLTELRIQMTSTRDMVMLPLPKPLRFLYPLLHIPLALCRRMLGGAH